MVAEDTQAMVEKELSAMDAEVQEFEKNVHEMEKEAEKLQRLSESAKEAPETINLEDEVSAIDAEVQEFEQNVLKMEKEAKKLKKLTEAIEEAPEAINSEEVDGRSVYVGNVDYGASPEELQEHFKSSGQINRITILVDRWTGHPKGFAYIEFAEELGMQNAQLMDGTLFRGRQLQVAPKRTHIPGWNYKGKGKGKGKKGKGKRYSPYWA